MNELLQRLPKKARRGSKPRCHLLTHGTATEVAGRLTALIEPWGTVRPTDAWMPQGFDQLEEAELHNALRLLPAGVSQQLLSWWLVATDGNPRTPNWDIASTCRIGGADGLLLVEAKAHEQEIAKEEAGRKIKPPVSFAARRNHARIGWCVRDASLALSEETGLVWALSHDWNYQMSNRFAWAWKLTQLGVPVVLVYLGFLNAREMFDRGRTFASAGDWQAVVDAHSRPLFPASIWNRSWKLNGQTFSPLIRTLELPLVPIPSP